MTENKKIIDLAIKARGNAYSPYSHFSVGAALLCDDGEIYTGCNVECSSYGDTVCAERVALFKALSEGKRAFTAMAVVGGCEEISAHVTPCGTCRQVLSEHCKSDFRIITFDGKEQREHTLDSLLPQGFNKESIK